jgi:hypothetical protein
MMYGGERTHNGHNDDEYGNPDIIHWDRNQVYESKGGISSDHHKLRPAQVENYGKIRRKVAFPEDYFLHGLSRAEPYYFLWQHKKRGISKVDDEQLEEIVIENTTRLLVLSYDIVSKGYDIWARTGATGPWQEQITFRSSERKEMTERHSEGLKRSGLKFANYDYTDEIVPAGEYTYTTQFTENWSWDIETPKFRLTTVINKNWNGLERITKEGLAEMLKEVPFA